MHAYNETRIQPARNVIMQRLELFRVGSWKGGGGGGGGGGGAILRYFADDNFKYVFVNKMYELPLTFHWSLFLMARLT